MRDRPLYVRRSPIWLGVAGLVAKGMSDGLIVWAQLAGPLEPALATLAVVGTLFLVQAARSGPWALGLASIAAGSMLWWLVMEQAYSGYGFTPAIGFWAWALIGTACCVAGVLGSLCRASQRPEDASRGFPVVVRGEESPGDGPRSTESRGQVPR